MPGPERGPRPTEQQREEAVRLLDHAYADGQLDTDYATVQMPVDGETTRFENWYLQGGAFNDSGRASSCCGVVDLADIDLTAAQRNLDRAWPTPSSGGQTDLGVEEPTRVAVEIQHWRHDEQPTVTVTVSNAFEESGYVITEAPYRAP